MSHAQIAPDKSLCFSFPSTSLAVREALANALAGLRNLNLSIEECGTLELVLAEAMNNIVEHAYGEDRNGVIELRLCMADNGLLCELLDQGKMMPDGQLPIGNAALLDCQMSQMPEGGFGWFLIRDLVRDLEYTRLSGKNRLRFRIAVNQP